jgi:hypothetical protein
MFNKTFLNTNLHLLENFSIQQKERNVNVKLPTLKQKAEADRKQQK